MEKSETRKHGDARNEAAAALNRFFKIIDFVNIVI
jgi:hypothetical protein